MKRGKQLLFILLGLTSIILLVLAIPIILAQEEIITPGVPFLGEMDPETGLPEGVAKIQNVTETLSDTEKRNIYLKEQWENIIQKWPVISSIHNFFKEWDIIFVVLLGMHYELSLALLIAVIFWIILAIKLPSIVKEATGFSTGLSIVIGIGAVIIFAQLRVLKIISEFLANFLVGQDAWWQQLLVGAIIFVIFIILYYFEDQIFLFLEERRKQMIKQESAFELKKMKAFGKGISK